jgi:glyoxylase-like metal-dependent hydrolase (beta-lactamase superfamily II)
VNINVLKLGDLGVNCYVVDFNGETMVIDPGADPVTVISRIQITRGKLKYLFLTHGHYDHIGAVDWVLDKFEDTLFYMGKPDMVMLGDATKNFSHYMGEPFVIKSKPQALTSDTELDLGGMKVFARPCPGHSEGSVSIYIDNHIFTGDLLFKNSVGRTDFPGGDMDTLLKSIKHNVMTFPDEFIVHPGHGESTSVGRERKENPFLVF